MYCFILFQMSKNLDVRYARMYHYQNHEDLEQRLNIMRNNGNVIIDVQEKIDNFIVAAL